MQTDATDVPTSTVLITLAPDPDAEPEDVERLSRQVFSMLNGLEIESLEPARSANPPAGSKAGEFFELGSWIMTLSAGGGVFAEVIGALRDWLGRQPPENRITVTIDGNTLELSNASAREQKDLVEAFIRRHSGE